MKPMAHPNTAGREAALQYLYMHDVLTNKDVQAFDEWLEHQQPNPDAESREFARKLVAAVIEHKAELDAELAAVAENWEVARMAVVDRNILRLGVAEMMSHPETTHNVVIDEAVELAKRFSSDEAGAFVNGLLDKLRLKLRPETVEGEKGTAEAHHRDTEAQRREKREVRYENSSTLFSLLYPLSSILRFARRGPPFR
jgi:N utilization substance protein B